MKMIIIDFSQVSISSITVTMGKNVSVDENLLRHICINSIRNIIKKFKNEYGKVVLACDNRNYWRRDNFPYYKASRREAIEKSKLDWELIFNTINNLKQELKEYFPYIVMEIEKAEADDIIGTLCERFGVELGSGSERILIVSGDKDFMQLQKYSNVDQYDPIRKRYLRTDNPELTLLNHIIYGDSGDGVPNIMSDDSCLVEKRRQKSITSKRYEDLKTTLLKGEMLSEEIESRFQRNKMLVDLSMIPSNIKDKINNLYDEGPETKDKSKIMSYIVKYKLNNLMEHLRDF